MTRSPCNLRRTGCTLVLCLCLIHLLLGLLYTLHSKEKLKFAVSSLQILAKADILFSSHVSRNATGGSGRGTTEPAPVLDLCPETPPRLVGPLRVDFGGPVSMERVQRENPEVQAGGHWKPRDCIARQKVAIIIPFRYREHHLKYWLYYLHPILQRQQTDYTVYVINQAGDTIFNKAKLMNAGVLEALKEYEYECFVFSDVDIIPMDDRNLYKCYSQPRHISVAVDKFGFRLMYTGMFGGVTALSKKQYMSINGFSNKYWGWGGEDDDISHRIFSKGMSISRPDLKKAKCRMIHHGRDPNNEENSERFDHLNGTKLTMETDGLNSLKYRVMSVEKGPLFTNVTVDIGKP